MEYAFRVCELTMLWLHTTLLAATVSYKGVKMQHHVCNDAEYGFRE
jgi:hypothetical protein